MAASLDSMVRGAMEGTVPPVTTLGPALREFAWALKDACYAAWSSEPQRAQSAAAALELLAQDARNSPTVEPSLRYELAAVASWTAGIAAITRGKLDEARAALDDAESGFAGLGQTANATQTRIPQIMVLAMRGDYDAAIACAASARAQFVALGDRRSAGKVSVNLSALHERRGEFHDAVRESRAAAVQFARVGDREHSIMADINTANALTSLGDFDEALRIYARVRMRADSHGYPVLDALAAESTALLKLVRGEYRDALAGLAAACSFYEQSGMPQQLAIADKQLGDAYFELNLLPEALARFRLAAQRFTELDMPDEHAWAKLQAGRVHAVLGEMAVAEAAFADAETSFGESGVAVGSAMVALARAELALSTTELSAAREHAQRAAAVLAECGLQEAELRARLIDAEVARRVGERDIARAAFADLARTADRQGLLAARVRAMTGNGEVALDEDRLDGAEVAFTNAIALLEDQRDRLPGSDLRAAFAFDRLAPYAGMLRIALRRTERDDSAARRVAVLRELERMRARSLDDATRLREPQAADDDTTQSLRERLHWLYRRLAQAEQEGDSATVLLDAVRDQEMRLLERNRRLRIAGTTSDVPTARFGELDVDALCHALNADQVLVAYGIVADELLACVVTREGVQLFRHLGRWSTVQRTIAAARFQFDALRHGAAPYAGRLDLLLERTTTQMRRLYAIVWAPLVAAIGGRRDVIVVPTSELGWLPFSALDDGNSPLLDHHAIAVAPSVRGWRAAARPRYDAPALVLAESSRLSHAADEAQAVVRRLPRALACYDAEATLQRFTSAAPDAEIIHLACHGEYRADNPLFSAVHLHDGPLTAEYVERLSLRAAVVVLSACETGVATIEAGDEPIGLVRAFLLAGAARVIASSWPVDDAVTSSLMNSFYTALATGCSAASALRSAQQSIRAIQPHPHFWAAFTIYGGH